MGHKFDSIRLILKPIRKYSLLNAHVCSYALDLFAAENYYSSNFQGVPQESNCFTQWYSNIHL